ncbi:MAG TPA: SRPBCC domain-containing protein [Bacteroidales bacterium]|nr:SRPBCC domain-containing protein [Bacteroidales bacterium]
MEENKSFTATILVDQDSRTVYNAIKDFRAWWSEDIEGNTDVLNEEFFYHYKDIHLCKIKLIEMVPDRKLVYLVLENEFNFIDDKREWVNTKLVFEIVPTSEGKTKVQFTHQGLTPEYECYNVCNEAWSNYIKNSLYKLITAGKGEPNPKDKEGFNAAIAKKWELKAAM